MSLTMARLCLIALVVIMSLQSVVGQTGVTELTDPMNPTVSGNSTPVDIISKVRDDIKAIITRGIKSLACGVSVSAEAAGCMSKHNDEWKDVSNRDRAECCSDYDMWNCLRSKASDKCDTDAAK